MSFLQALAALRTALDVSLHMPVPEAVKVMSEMMGLPTVRTT